MTDLPFAVLALCIGFVVLIVLLGIAKRATSSRRKSPRNMRDPKLQLEAVSNIGFQRTKLMNKGEFRVFLAVEALLARHNNGHRVMAQVNLGEIVEPDPAAPDVQRREAFASINSKRVDMLVIDRFGDAVAAIEIQGSGHHLGKTAFMRDAVKREALRRAGVAFLEVDPTKPVDRLQAALSDALTHRARAVA
jgi:hypothetical protein